MLTERKQKICLSFIETKEIYHSIFEHLLCLRELFQDLQSYVITDKQNFFF